MKKKLAILFLSSLITLLAAELAIRVISRFMLIYDIEMSKYAVALKLPSSNPQRGHYHRHNVNGRFMGVEIVTNSLGLRDKERSVQKPKNTFRIMVLGDSITLGWGVRQEDCYTNQLEEMLRINISKHTGLTYEVINTGVGNYNTSQEWSYFSEAGYKFIPDMVILGFSINDAELVPQKSKNLLLNHSRLAVFFWSKKNLIASLIFPEQRYKEYYKNLYNDSNPGWLRCKNALIELNNYCNKNKMRLLVVFIPELHDLSDAYPFQDVRKKMGDFTESQSISYLDLYPYFKNKNGKKLWVSYDDAHPNKTGHEIIAQGIYDYLTREGWL